MNIDIRHIELRCSEIVLNLIVNGLPVSAYYCTYSGDIFLDFHENESLLIDRDDEIKDFIFNVMN